VTGILPEPTPTGPTPPHRATAPADPAVHHGEAPATYADSGVDITAGERAVDLIKPLVASTLRPEVLGGLGEFGGLFALDTARYRQPVLVAGTDGVGTKALVAQATGSVGTIGLDLVAMCVDDLVCQGAEPLFVLDYIATGAVDPGQMTELVAGVAEGCRQVGATLLGGEMAEHPGVMKPGEFDLVGFAVGAVERSMMLGPSRVQPGDTLIGLGSPGLRCNGYTLARQVLLERAGLSLDGPAWTAADHSLADELLRPSVIYTPAVRAAMAATEVDGRPGVHAAAHITGGGFGGNVPRALPDGMRAVIDRSTWEVPRIFTEIRRLGHVADDEMARVFNLGLGMIVMVAPDRSEAALVALLGAGVDAVVVGRVEPGERGVEFVGAPFWPSEADGADRMASG
jgi:phosphoribosylformylglycinamidine cyclo-ligase